jgi:hypothetical protein
VEASLDPRLYLDPVQRSLADQLPSNGVALPEPSMLAAVGAVWALAAARSRRR